MLIAFLDAEDAFHSASESLLAEAAEEALAVHPLTLAEVLVAPVRLGRLEPVLAALADLEVATLPFPADGAIRLARLRADTGLKMPDCCVLLAAADSGGRLATFDDRLALAARRLDVEVLNSDV